MAMELILEGTLEKEAEREGFTQVVKDICLEQTLKIEDYEHSFIIDVCPQGYIECSFEGVLIRIVAQTNVAGPGFHAFVAQLYDEIILQSGIAFVVFDQTQYYENRDFEALKYKYFYPWLTQICDYVKEHGESEKNICICWPMDQYRPQSREGYVVTPLGYQAISTFLLEDIEDLAETFFIWNHITRDAMYYRNCALALLWKESFFEYSTMNEYTYKIANMIIDYMEAAVDEDSTIELPYDEYTCLCDSVYREKIIHKEQSIQTKHAFGYRRGLVYYPFNNWLIAVNGIQEKTFDAVTQTMNIMAPYKVDDEPWKWFIKVNIYQEEANIGAWMKNYEGVCSLDHDDIKGSGVVLKEDGYSRFVALFHHAGEVLQMDCLIVDVQMVEMLKDWCMKCEYTMEKDYDGIH